MKISTAFSIRAKVVVAFVGGGGKTTALFRLAGELVAQGKRVVTTTTTRIFAAQIRLAPQHVKLETGELEIGEIRRALERQPHVLVIGATNDDGKAFGIAPARVDELIALDEVDAVLVEADGSRMRPFKAPGEHEPVIPNSTTLLVPVVGIDVLGKPLNDEYVHRAELVAQLAGIPLETVLEPEHIARVLAHPQGGVKNKPRYARVIPLINKVENDAQRTSALEIAQRLLAFDAIDAVAIGAVRNHQLPTSNLQLPTTNFQPPTSNLQSQTPSIPTNEFVTTPFQLPISSLESRISAVILAAGGSTRMRGETKQLLPWGDATLVRNAVEIARGARVAEIVVVTGHRADQVERELRETGKVKTRVVFNPTWATGRASSVRAGIHALNAQSAAAVFINADQPFLTTSVLDALIARFAATRAPIVAPTFEGQPGSPVLFARELFDELALLTGDVGGKALFEKYRAQLERVAMDDARAAIDIDTPEEYRAAIQRMKDEGERGR
ncbi:MAG: putative selenium-dependent hydroxylase accessory protein YqeC [Chloroflexi bacterium]|nr:putative selenium-dependent hydroxylase accessory protein YqeC [Chloroflexota bacterium]